MGIWCGVRDDLQSWRPCAPDRLGGTRPSKNFALLVCCLLRPVGQQCACAALSLALAYALLAQNACWTACSDQFGGQLGVGDACCPFLFVSGGCGQSFGRLILGSLLSEGCLLVLLLLLLSPPPWQGWCWGWRRSTLPLRRCSGPPRYHARGVTTRGGIELTF